MKRVEAFTALEKAVHPCKVVKVFDPSCAETRFEVFASSGIHTSSTIVTYRFICSCESMSELGRIIKSQLHRRVERSIIMHMYNNPDGYIGAPDGSITKDMQRVKCTPLVDNANSMVFMHPEEYSALTKCAEFVNIMHKNK